MIGRGRYNDIHLYEVTEQDLLFDDGVTTTYRAGNVLMFADKRAVTLGAELARADDLAAAKEYLSRELTRERQQDDRSKHESQSVSVRLTPTELTSELVSRDEGLRKLTEKIEQRDELLKDLSESLKAQKRDNELLYEQLEQARTQLAVDELRHNELVDDLQHVSAETLTIESTLEKVIDERFRLEQELAERITELVELSLQNDDLKKQLDRLEQSVGTSPSPRLAQPVAGTDANTDVAGGATTEAVARAAGGPDRDGGFPAEQNPRVLTMSSGKKIHILHEFPTAPKPTLVTHANHALGTVLRVAAIILFALLALGAASVIATARVNGISYGDALDLIARSLNLS
jgi:hypothetical protein